MKNKPYVRIFSEGYGDFLDEPALGKNFDSVIDIWKFCNVVHGASVFRVFDTEEQAKAQNPNANCVRFHTKGEVGEGLHEVSELSQDLNWGTGEFSYERYIAVYSGNLTSNLMKSATALYIRMQGRNSAQLPIAVLKVKIEGLH